MEEPHRPSQREEKAGLSVRPSFPFILPRFPPLPPLNKCHENWQQKHQLLVTELQGCVQRLCLALEECKSSLLSRFHVFLLSIDSHPQQRWWALELPRPHSHRRHELSNYNFAAILPGDSVAGLVAANGVLNFLNIYNTLLVVRLILTWFPQPPQIIANPLSTICDPYLNIFRGIIPPLGGTIDLSPILAFLVLNAFTNAATALPAELPGTTSTPEAMAANRQQQLGFPSLTGIQKAWLKRQGVLTTKKA